jgi:hypothetical protein
LEGKIEVFPLGSLSREPRKPMLIRSMIIKYRV